MNPYNPYSGRGKVDFSRIRQDPRQNASAQKRADDKNWWANMAPTLGALGGTALGAGVGGIAAAATGGAAAPFIPMAMGIGSQLGSGIGGAVGQGFANDAQRELDPMREKAMREEALLMAMMQMGRR